MSVRVRTVAGAADFSLLRGLFVAYEADLPLHLRHGDVPTVEELAQNYAAGGRAFLALRQQRAVGCVAVRRFDSETALLLRLYVVPEHRGVGAARALLHAAISFARERECRRMVLDTNKEALGAAYRLYRALGFVECAPFTKVTYACPTFMELALEP